MTPPAAKIAADGVYDGVPIDLYHGDLCDGPSVSGTGLVCIEQLSLRHYWHRYLNPNREPVDTTALAFGRAVHAWVLGVPAFEAEFVVSPFDDFRTKAAREWRDSETRTVVRIEQFEAIKAMAVALQEHPLLRNAFTDGKPEQTIVWKDIDTGLWLKSRPDWLPNSLRFVPNFKSCRSAKPEAFARAAFGFGYHQGAALCLEGIRTVLGWDAQYYFVAQEKDPPYVALPYVMRDTDLEWGALLNRRALRKLADALSADKWPAYADGAVEIAMPAWAEKQLLDQHEAGQFTDEKEQAA